MFLVTVAGTSTFDSELVFDDGKVLIGAWSKPFDSNAKRFLLLIRTHILTHYGTAVLLISTIATTRGQVTNGQAASVDVIGSVSENQIGLTAGQQYFVQNDGTISTTADSPSVLADAISATELVVKT